HGQWLSAFRVSQYVVRIADASVGRLMQHFHFLSDLWRILSVRSDIPPCRDEHCVDQAATCSRLVKLKNVGGLLRLVEDELKLFLGLFGGLGFCPCILKVLENLRHPSFLLGQLTRHDL